MVYVPTPPPAPSREARELSKAIVTLVGEYRRNNPKTSDQAVLRALQLAKADLTPGGSSDRKALLIGIAVALLMGFLLLGFFLFRAAGGY